MRLSNWHKGILATLIANVIWGVAAPMVKLTVELVPPTSLVFLRSLFVCLILFPFFEFNLLPKQPRLTWQDKKEIFLAGFLGVFLNLIFYFVGQKLTTVIDAFVIISMGTPLLILFSYFFLHERLSKTVYFGSALAFIGTLVIIGSPILSFGQGSLLGNLLAFGATISAVTSFLIIKRLVSKVSPMILTFYFFLTSLVFSTPLFVWDFLQNPYWIASLQESHLIMIAYFVLGSSIGAYYLTNLGLKFIPPSIASTIGYISTVVGVLLGIVFLKEQITPFFVIGTILIVIGLLLAETRHRHKKLNN